MTFLSSAYNYIFRPRPPETNPPETNTVRLPRRAPLNLNPIKNILREIDDLRVEIDELKQVCNFSQDNNLDKDIEALRTTLLYLGATIIKRIINEKLPIIFQKGEESSTDQKLKGTHEDEIQKS